MSFLGDVAAYGMDPLALGAGLILGYLFHADFTKLAWLLLLSVIPGIGSMWAPDVRHGTFYYAVAEFLSICAITAVSYWIFELRMTRAKRT
jgi:hypothetical protein